MTLQSYIRNIITALVALFLAIFAVQHITVSDTLQPGQTISWDVDPPEEWPATTYNRQSIIFEVVIP